MNCPKCGRALKEGNMLCEFCGEEIRIVPDFVPEIELSIEESINNMVMDLNPSLDEDNSGDTTEIQINKEEESPFDELKIPWHLTLIYILVLAIVLGGLLGGIALMYVHDNSASYQVESGDKLVASGEVRKAIDCYNRAVLLEPSSIECRIKLADCYMELGNTDAAVEVYKEMIVYEPNSTLAYAQIIAIYESEGNYGAIDDFLHHNANDDIRASFVDYLADEPEFSVEAGTYEDDITISLTNESAGTIYYTLDGTVPSESSTVFTEPILLKKGKYTVNAFFKNEYGVCSSIVTKIYEVKAGIPAAPVISLESGAYTSPQVIKVEVPAGCSVYYTDDGSTPDRSSRIYGEPIPLEQGISHYKFACIDKMNVSSDIVEANYKLEVATSFTEAEGLVYLYMYLVSKGYILDYYGASSTYPGNFSYLYSAIREIGGKSLYVYNEYYVYGTEARAMTSIIFGVDVNTGEVYLIKHGHNDSFDIAPF